MLWPRLPAMPAAGIPRNQALWAGAKSPPLEHALTAFDTGLDTLGGIFALHYWHEISEDLRHRLFLIVMGGKVH